MAEILHLDSVISVEEIFMILLMTPPGKGEWSGKTQAG